MAFKMEKEILFSETQKFRQWWLWLIMVFVCGIMAFVIFQIMSRQEFKSDPLPLIIIVSSGVFILLPTILLLFNMKLETQIRKDGIYVKFFPFHLSFKEYKWNDVRKSYVRQYNPMSEYGGWGLRWGLAGKAFNVSGDKGLQLEFLDNKKVLIGTNKAEELKATLLHINQLKD
jgi:hypothetical protein